MHNIERLHAAQRRPPRPTEAPVWSDDGLALAFANKHAGELRYVALWGKWLRWDDTRWRTDDTLCVFDLARRLCRELLESGTPLPRKAVAALSDASTFAAVERVARSDRRLAATTDQWDADPWLLNTPGGTVDLRTGAIRSHSPEDLISKITAVAPEAGASCPLWRTFLHRVTCGDEDLQEYLQRLCGYALTGSIREHVLAFFWGTGGNGKGVFLNTITFILGDYAAVAPAQMFESTNSDRHPTELAMLRGARLVTAQETEEGRQWAEAKIKALTGGDPITARYMRQDFFTFAPTFTLLIAGNHKPGLRSVDEAMRCRLHLVPFIAQIPPAEQDKNLPEKLKAEWPGILGWCIDGCLKWQEDGLRPPPVVLAATADYFASADTFAQWLEDCCERTDWSRENSGDLYASWRAWGDKAGERDLGNRMSFADRMKSNGFAPKREPGTGKAGFAGIALRRQDYTESRRYGS